MNYHYYLLYERYFIHQLQYNTFMLEKYPFKNIKIRKTLIFFKFESKIIPFLEFPTVQLITIISFLRIFFR